MKLFPIPYITVLKLVTAISLLSLGSAYVAEYAFGFKPCKLCIYQRIPYFCLVLVSVAGWIVNKEHLLKFLNYVCGIIFLISFTIACYHVAVEHGIILESCSITDTISDFNTLKNLILKQVISCKDVPFRIFNFSMAEVNALISISLTIAIFYNTKASLKN
jgi:disulfide bond formation protein DsbB